MNGLTAIYTDTSSKRQESKVEVVNTNSGNGVHHTEV